MTRFHIIFIILVTVLFSTGLCWADEPDLTEYQHLTIRSIELTGLGITRPHVVERELTLRSGQSFDVKRLKQDLRRLENLDIFSSIDVIPFAKNDSLSLTFNFREIPFMLPYVTYDYTEEDGWSFGPSVKAVNLFGRDISANGFALFGGRTMFLLNTIYPWITGNHVSTDMTIARIKRENKLDDFNETSLELTSWIGTYLGENGRAKIGASFFRVQSDTSGHTLSVDNSDEMLRIGFGLGYDTRDVWGNPHRGGFSEIELIKTGGFLGGAGDFLTAHLDIRRFIPVTMRHTLALGGLLTLQTGEMGADIPEYMDFHLGGSNSIRGYDITKLGRTLYGKNQVLCIGEYRFTMRDPREISIFGLSVDVGLAGAFFLDSGIAWSEPDDFDANRFKTGFGFGLRLLLPAIDMTRFDIGFDGEGNWQIHFAAFSKMKAQRYRLR